MASDGPWRYPKPQKWESKDFAVPTFMAESPIRPLSRRARFHWWWRRTVDRLFRRECRHGVERGVWCCDCEGMEPFWCTEFGVRVVGMDRSANDESRPRHICLHFGSILRVI